MYPLLWEVAPNVNEATAIQEPKVSNVVISEEEDQPQNLENTVPNQGKY
jgi:hypothetical protein